MNETLIKTGTILIATDVCEMEFSNKHALIIGKEYEVLGLDGDSFWIKSEDTEQHFFDTHLFRDFFIIKGEPMPNKIKITLPQLTKHEYFAGLAMQSILSNPPDGHIDCGSGKDHIKICKLSIEYADELLKQLEKQP